MVVYSKLEFGLLTKTMLGMSKVAPNSWFSSHKTAKSAGSARIPQHIVLFLQSRCAGNTTFWYCLHNSVLSLAEIDNYFDIELALTTHSDRQSFQKCYWNDCRRFFSSPPPRPLPRSTFWARLSFTYGHLSKTRRCLLAQKAHKTASYTG